MKKTNTGAVRLAITLKAEDYALLEELRQKEGRIKKSSQIAWIIKQYAAGKASAPEPGTAATRDIRRNGNIIYPAWN